MTRTSSKLPCRRMFRLTGCGMLAAIGVVASTCPPCAQLVADEGEDERVEELMERTHEGRKSPFERVRTMLAGGDLSWAVVDESLPVFEAMALALQESAHADIKGSADGYVGGVKDLRAAAKRRDAKALRAGFTGLTQSCGDCHFEGGVGGVLEEEEEDEEEEKEHDEET